VPIAVTPDPEQAPSASVDAFGNAVVAYQSRHDATDSIKAKRDVGGVLGPEIIIRNSTENLNSPSVALQVFGRRFVVAFKEPAGGVRRVGVAEVSASDGVLGLPSISSRYRPSVSIDGASRYQLTYETLPPLTDSSGSGIRRRRGAL